MGGSAGPRCCGVFMGTRLPLDTPAPLPASPRQSISPDHPGLGVQPRRTCKLELDLANTPVSPSSSMALFGGTQGSNCPEPKGQGGDMSSAQRHGVPSCTTWAASARGAIPVLDEPQDTHDGL